MPNQKLNKMKEIFSVLCFLFLASGFASEGPALFKQHCGACHTIGQGKLVGPDLIDIQNKRDNAWLISFIKSSGTMIASGDELAIKVFNDYGMIRMPDPAVTEPQISEILDYIVLASSDTSMQNLPVVVDILSNTTNENIERGRKYFSGQTRLSACGASCLGCHSIKDNKMLPGGTLAKDLSATYSLMGSAGIAAILRSAPFPAMAETYKSNALTEEEVIDITAYLRAAGEEGIYQHPSQFDLSFGYLGLFASAIFLSGIFILYINRKTRAVNHKIYNRQN